MNKAIAEFIGTFVFVLFGVGALVFGAQEGLGLALAVGLVLAAAYILVAGTSGAHLNPAVTLGSALSGRTSWPDAVQYWIAQLAGGIAAVFVIWLVGQITDTGLEVFGGNVTIEGFDVVGTIILEALLVALFVLVFFKISESGESLVTRGLTIGLTFSAVYLVGSATDGSANLAKSLGAAVFEGNNTDALADIWVYIVGAAAGAVLAWLVTIVMPKDAAKEAESVSS